MIDLLLRKKVIAGALVPSGPVPSNALKFTNVGIIDAYISLSNYDNSPVLYYSYDGVSGWKWNYSVLSLAVGESVYIWGDNPGGFCASNAYSSFEIWTYDGFDNARVSCEGSVMSLLGEDILTIPCNHCFRHLFSSCSALTTAPELPATTLTEGCYYEMFFNCESLTAAPELPATTLAKECYRGMFFQSWSYNTPQLSYIKCLAEDLSAEGALENWMYGIGSSGIFVKKAGVEWPTGVSGIPEGWTVFT